MTRRLLAVVAVVVLLAAGCDRPPPAPPTTHSTVTTAATTTAPSASTTTLPATADRPDPHLTPGTVADTDPKVVCQPGYAKAHRHHLSAAAKRRILAAYHLPPTTKVAEYDHDVPLELGGADTPIANIWPQTSAADKRRKDRLEGVLKRLACSHQISLQAAQERIRTYWDDPLW
jgi:hypothetical protein